MTVQVLVWELAEGHVKEPVMELVWADVKVHVQILVPMGVRALAREAVLSIKNEAVPYEKALPTYFQRYE